MTLTKDERRWAITAIFLVLMMLLVVALAEEPCAWSDSRQVGLCSEYMRWDAPPEGTTTYYRIMRRQAGMWHLFGAREEVGRVRLLGDGERLWWSTERPDGSPAWNFADDAPPRESGKLYSYRVIPANGAGEGRISRPPRVWYREPD